MIWLLLLVLVALLIIYIKIKYFTLRGPLPGLSPHFFFGNLIQSGLLGGEKTLPQALIAFQKRFGDVFQFWLGSTYLIVVSGADDVKHIFTHRKIYDHGGTFVETVSVLIENSILVLNGAKYKRHLALTVPLLRRAKIVLNLDIILDCTDRLLAKWRESSIDHIHKNIVQNCENLILDIFGFIAFDFDLRTLDSSNEIGNNEFTRALHDFLSTFKIITYLPRILAGVCLRWYPRHQRAQKIIEKYLYRAMDQELANSEDLIEQEKKRSFISSLVSSLQKDEKAEALRNEDDQQGLSRKEILDEMLAFMIAGYETTSTVLAWFIHLMSKYPRVQQKIKAELMVDNTSEDLTLDRIDSLIYLDCVINEVVRFFTPVSGTIRMVYTDDRLPENGAHLSKGTEVFIPFCSLARDPRLWSIDPDTFYPERFLNEDKDHHPYALIPFGGGHRQCVGQDLARFELKVIMARLMQHVTFGDGGSQVNAGGFVSGVTEKPRDIGITIKFD